jgi:hypothetical protein
LRAWVGSWGCGRGGRGGIHFGVDEIDGVCVCVYQDRYLECVVEE